MKKNYVNTENLSDFLGFEPSRYQKKVFDFVLHGNGNGVIKAVAGSGKTKTIVSAMRLVPPEMKCLFIAFNKSIVQELTERLQNHDNCTVKTIHSLGYSIIKGNLRKEIEVDEYKYTKYIRENIHDLSGGKSKTMSDSSLYKYVRHITRLTDFARFNCAQSEREIIEVAKKYSLNFSSDECAVVERCLKWGKEHLDTIDYTDMVWLPYELSMNPFQHQYDWIFADEVQDFSVMATELFFRCFKRGTRFIAVGDTNQSINMFAGSSADAFNTLCEYRNTEMFTLPVTYRCAKKIVEYCKNLSPETIAADGAPEGDVIRDFPLMSIQPGDMVLSRTRSPLMTAYVKFLRNDVPCYVKGAESAVDLLSLIDSYGKDETELNSDLSGDGLFIRMYADMLDERDNMVEKNGMTTEEATLSSHIMDMYDNINSLSILSYGLNTSGELKDRITSMFEASDNSVCLSTIHKAKGLEAERVFVLCNSTMPSSLAKTDMEVQQELNIQYVAYTRPRTVLGFVSESDVPPSATQLMVRGIVREIDDIETAVCNVTGRQPSKRVTNSDIAVLADDADTSADLVAEIAQNKVVGIFRKNDSSILDKLASCK